MSVPHRSVLLYRRASTEEPAREWYQAPRVCGEYAPSKYRRRTILPHRTRCTAESQNVTFEEFENDPCSRSPSNTEQKRVEHACRRVASSDVHLRPGTAQQQPPLPGSSIPADVSEAPARATSECLCAQKYAREEHEVAEVFVERCSVPAIAKHEMRSATAAHESTREMITRKRAQRIKLAENETREPIQTAVNIAFQSVASPYRQIARSVTEHATKHAHRK